MTAEPKSIRRPPLMSRIPASFVQAVLKGHSGLGIAFAAAIYLVCLSGTLAVFADEFLHWENAGVPVAAVGEVSPEATQRALEQTAARAENGLEHVFITMPAGDIPFMRIEMYGATEGGWIADTNGDLIAPLNSAWTEFLRNLHIYLHLPATWGIFVVGMTGVALLSSLISGLLAHPRIFRDAFHLRLGGSKRLQEADLHNRIGVWGLPFHVIVSLSGAFLGLTTIIVGVLGLAMFKGDTNRIYDLFIAPHPIDNPASAPLLDLRPMFAQLPADSGRLERISLEHPTEQGGAALFDTRHDGALAEAESFAFTRDGTLYYSKRLEDYTQGERVLGSLGPLHFGWFGGGVVKIAYGLLGLGLTYLAVGGVRIWLARRRDKGRPAPGWEKVWAALVWGQPLAMAFAALVAVLTPARDYGSLIPIWGVVTLGVLLSSSVLSPMAISRAGRGLTGAILVVLGAWHAIFVTAGSSQLVPWAINVSLVTSGLLLAAWAWRAGTARKLATGSQS